TRVHAYGKLSPVGSSPRARGNEQCLFGVSGITLLDGDHGEWARLAAVNETPDALHFGNSGLLQLLPKRSGTERDGEITGWGFQRRRAQHNRIISIIDPLHHHDWRFADVLLGEITRPLPKGSFLGHLLVLHVRKLTFENDSGMRGNRQTSHGSPCHGDRRSLEIAGKLKLIHVGWQRHLRRKENRRPLA